MGTMVKLAYCMVAAGAALVAYPHLTKPPEYHRSFEPDVIDAVENPINVKVLTLGPQKNAAGLQTYLFKTEVLRQYNAPTGFAEEFDRALTPFKNRSAGQQASVTAPLPEYVVRFEGKSAAVDVVVSIKQDSVWFVRQGALRPFYSRYHATIGKELGALIRQTLTRN